MKYLLKIVLCFAINACSFQTDRLEKVDSLMNSYHRENYFDGSISIGTSQGLVYSKSFGLANREWDITVDSKTRFDIGSLNKSFVALMIMKLVEQGKLRLNDQLSDYLPYKSSIGRHVTIHQMLTHTSGLPDYEQLPDSVKGRQYEEAKRMHFETDEYIDFIAKLPMVGAPGEQFYYSNYAYHLLAIIIERIERKPFSQILEEMVCQPLGLDRTYNPVDNYRVYPQLAEPYQWDGNEYVKSPFIDYSIGRRIFSTTEDLYKWGAEVANPTLLSSESNQLILTNHIKDLNQSVSYGYGWAVFDGGGDYQMGRLDIDGNYAIHGGSTDGYRSILVIYEGGEGILSLLTNIGDRFDELETAERILKILTENE